ncbi:hypothetical protein VNO77_46948 [Canavalia gladiata]|uniref:Uncharacterized protein n=1 Tax=Canavalia gladiata TaxID=3824 RepID=A0AAN9PIM3_CANGL
MITVAACQVQSLSAGTHPQLGYLFPIPSSSLSTGLKACEPTSGCPMTEMDLFLLLFGLAYTSSYKIRAFFFFCSWEPSKKEPVATAVPSVLRHRFTMCIMRKMKRSFDLYGKKKWDRNPVMSRVIRLQFDIGYQIDSLFTLDQG